MSWTKLSSIVSKLVLKFEPSPFQNRDAYNQKNWNWGVLQEWAASFVNCIDSYFGNLDERINDQIASNTIKDEEIDARHSDMLNKTFATMRARGDFFDQSFLDLGVNVKFFGAVGDGVTDDTDSINNAISSAKGSGNFVYFPAGTYLISSTIRTPYPSSENVDIIFSPRAIVKTNTSLNSLFELMFDDTTVANVFDKNHQKMLFSGGNFDATNCKCGIKVNCDRKGFVIKDINVYFASEKQLWLCHNNSENASAYSADGEIQNVQLRGQSSMVSGSYGLYFDTNVSDNKIYNLRVWGCETAIYDSGADNILDTVHIIPDNYIDGKTVDFTNLTGIIVNDGSSIIWRNVYFDTYATGAYLGKNVTGIITNCIYYSYMPNVGKYFINSPWDYKNSNKIVLKNNQILNVPQTGFKVFNVSGDQQFLSDTHSVKDNIIYDKEKLDALDLFNATAFTKQNTILTSQAFLPSSFTQSDYVLAFFLNINFRERVRLSFDTGNYVDFTISYQNVQDIDMSHYSYKFSIKIGYVKVSDGNNIFALVMNIQNSNDYGSVNAIYPMLSHLDGERSLKPMNQAGEYSSPQTLENLGIDSSSLTVNYVSTLKATS